LINLLNPAGELVGGLSPIMVLHGDDKNGLDFLRAGRQAENTHKNKDTEDAEQSAQLRHTFSISEFAA
jgi:hypothetical protein